MLRVLSSYISEIPPVTVDGIFGPATRAAVIAAQRRFGLSQTGSVNFDTWEAIYNQFIGIADTSLRDFENLPITSAVAGNSRSRYTAPAHITQFPGAPLSGGDRDPNRQEASR